MLCTNPKNTVKPTTNATANQKLNDWTGFLRSDHHCRTVLGSASSKACLSIAKRSCQNSKLPSCLCFIDRGWHLIALPSINSSIKHLFCSLRNHAVVFLSPGGKSNDRVRRVSSINPGGKISLLKIVSHLSCVRVINKRCLPFSLDL